MPGVAVDNVLRKIDVAHSEAMVRDKLLRRSTVIASTIDGAAGILPRIPALSELPAVVDGGPT